MRTAIVKPLHACNFSCDYCYIDEKAENGKMSSSLLEKFILEFGKINKNKRASIIWHGGEPLLMGTQFFEEARYIEYWAEKEFNCRFDNSIQTNGSLLTEDMAKYFAKHKFSVGFSLDGPGDVNDRTRKYQNGASTFKDIVRGLDIAKKHNIGGGFITVLSKKNIDHIEEIYHFAKKHRYGLKVNPLIHSGNATENIEDLGIKPQEYGIAMNKLFDLYFNDPDPKISVEPLDSLISNISFGQSQGVCTFGTNCQENFISVGPLGDVYPCGRFDGVEEFNMGNLNTDSLEDIAKGPVRKYLLSRRIDSMKSCQPCEYNSVCNGGCMSNGFMIDEEIMDKDYYCPSYKNMFSHIKQSVLKEFEQAKVE